MGTTEVALQSYTDRDVYGRGCDEIFGEGSQQENERSAKVKLKQNHDSKAGIRLRAIVDYDLYGRGDPRVFGKDAHVVNREEAQAHLKLTRRKNKRSFRHLMFPSRTTALVRIVSTHSMRGEEHRLPIVPSVSQETAPQPMKTTTTSFDSTPRRVASKPPSEEAKAQIEYGILLRGTRSFDSSSTSSDIWNTVRAEEEIEKNKVKRSVPVALAGIASASIVGAAVLRSSGNDDSRNVFSTAEEDHRNDAENASSQSEANAGSEESSDIEVSESTAVSNDSDLDVKTEERDDTERACKSGPNAIVVGIAEVPRSVLFDSHSGESSAPCGISQVIMTSTSEESDTLDTVRADAYPRLGLATSTILKPDLSKRAAAPLAVPPPHVDESVSAFAGVTKTANGSLDAASSPTTPAGFNEGRFESSAADFNEEGVGASTIGDRPMDGRDSESSDAGSSTEMVSISESSDTETISAEDSENESSKETSEASASGTSSRPEVAESASFDDEPEASVSTTDTRNEESEEESSEAAVSSSDEIMTDSDQDGSESDENYVHDVDNVDDQ
jgi:hypothetical protein